MMGHDVTERSHMTLTEDFGRSLPLRDRPPLPAHMTDADRAPTESYYDHEQRVAEGWATIFADSDTMADARAIIVNLLATIDEMRRINVGLVHEVRELLRGQQTS